MTKEVTQWVLILTLMMAWIVLCVFPVLPMIAALHAINSFILHPKLIPLVLTGVHQRWLRKSEVGPAVMGTGVVALIPKGEMNGRIQNCIFIEGVGWHFLGRQGSRKAPLEDQTHSQQTSWGQQNTASWETNKARREQKHKKLHKNKPSLRRRLRLPSPYLEINPQLLRVSLFISEG